MATKTNKNTFSINSAVSYGWRQATSKLSFFVVMFLIVIAASFVPSILSSLLDHDRATLLGFIIKLVGWGLQLTVSLGLINVALRLYDRKKVTYSDLFQNVHLVLPYFLASVIYGLIVMVGFILLIVPGIILSIKFRYYTYFMVEKGLGPIDALKASSKITEGVKWKLFFLNIVLALINLLGIITIILGLFVTVPLTMMAEVYVYKKLTTK